MKGIAIIGPESTGKTSLGEYLSKSLQCSFIKEYAREFLEVSKGKYDQSDLLKMANTQLESHLKMADQESKSWIADTEALVIKIWSREKYGSADPIFDDIVSRQPFDFYLLCRPDISWQYDPLREVPEQKDRERIFQLLKEELEKRELPFFIVSGRGEDRSLSALRQVESYLTSH